MIARLFVLALFAGSIVAINAASFAEEKNPGLPDEKTIMDAMMKAGTPGEAHKKLNHFEGNWDVDVKMWMNPAKPPLESTATAEYKWILGGRFLEEKVVGNFGGMKFEGIGLTGYDNTGKKYHSTWIDNMATRADQSTGELSDDGKTFTYGGESLCPITSKPIKGRAVLKIVDHDKHVLEMYKAMEMDGKTEEMKVMQLTYTRKK